MDPLLDVLVNTDLGFLFILYYLRYVIGILYKLGQLLPVWFTLQSNFVHLFYGMPSTTPVNKILSEYSQELLDASYMNMLLADTYACTDALVSFCVLVAAYHKYLEVDTDLVLEAESCGVHIIGLHISIFIIRYLATSTGRNFPRSGWNFPQKSSFFTVASSWIFSLNGLWERDNADYFCPDGSGGSEGVLLQVLLTTNLATT